MKRMGSGDQNIAFEAHGRRIELLEARVALVEKIPVRNRMRRTWLTLEQLGRDTRWPGVGLKIDAGEFMSVRAQISPGESPALFLEGLHYRFFYRGQTAGENVQSFFSHNSFTFNGIRPELKRRVGLRGGAPRISRTNHLLFRERRGVAWWVTALKSARGPQALLLGAGSANVFPTSFTIVKEKDGHRIDVYQGLQCEYVHLNRAFQMDPVMIQITDSILETFHRYGQATGASQSARPQSPPVRGWSSWYKYYPRIDESIIGREAALAPRKLPGFSLLQIDDGYQPMTGDWTPDPGRFPSGMAPIARKIRAQGLTPGIWLSPFMADKRSELARTQAQPDWFLHSYRGKRLTYRIPRHSVNYILDVTNPKVEEWLRSTIRRYREWGFDYLKIDFLMLQAAQARRFDTSVTGLEAYRRGLRLIREAAGEDAQLLLSGSIDLAGVGLAGAARTGPDIAYDILGGNTRLAFIKAQMCATASHFFTAHRWFTPNPDAVVIRPPLKESLAEMMLAQAAMTAGDFILSDDLGALSEDRLRKLNHPLFREIASSKGTLTPLDYFEHVSPLKVPPNPLMVAGLYNPPRVWLWRSPGREVLFLYNFGFSKQTVAHALEGKRSQSVSDIFHGEELRIVDGAFSAELPAESVRIFPLA